MTVSQFITYLQSNLDPQAEFEPGMVADAEQWLAEDGA